MTTDTLTHDDLHDADHEHEAHHPSDASYWVIFFILVAITAAEVSLSYMSVGQFYLPALLTLMAIKFWTVVSFFMHLRFDNKLFSVLFYAGLFLAISVYIAALTTAQFWAS
jgi:cytochrome c oxidase subunit 4